MVQASLKLYSLKRPPPVSVKLKARLEAVRCCLLPTPSSSWLPTREPSYIFLHCSDLLSGNIPPKPLALLTKNGVYY